MEHPEVKLSGAAIRRAVESSPGDEPQVDPCNILKKKFRPKYIIWRTVQNYGTTRPINSIYLAKS